MKLAVPDMISPSYFPALAAIELGFFQREGLDVEAELRAPVNRSFEALRDGEVELVGGSAYGALSAFPEWRGAKLVCAQSHGTYWFLVMRADLHAARGDLSVLRGKRIGAAPWVDIGLLGLLAEAGMDPAADKIDIAPISGTLGLKVNIGVVAADALADGRIDGFWANGMGAEVAVRHGVGTVLLDVRRGDGPPGCFGYTFPAITTSDRLIAAAPRVPAAVRRAMKATHAALREDVSLATQVGRKLFPPQEAELIAELITRDLPFYGTEISAAAVASMHAFSRAVGILASDPAYADVVAA